MPQRRLLTAPGCLLYPFLSGALALAGCSAAAPASPPATSPPATGPASAPLTAPPAPTPPLAAASALVCSPERRVQALGRDLCLEPELLPWTEAEGRCAKAGGRLATVESFEENAALFASLASAIGPVGNVWLGLSQDDQDGWRWLDGAALDSPPWAPGEPNNMGGNERCGMAYVSSGQWNDETCTTPLSFFCALAPAPARPARGGFRPFLCPGRTLPFEGAELCYHEAPQPWELARVTCASSGGALLTLPTPARREAFARALWPRARFDRVWLGYTDEGHEGDWRTSTGAALRFSLWAQGEPNNSGGREHCAEWSAHDGHWNDAPCLDRRPSLCEASGP